MFGKSKKADAVVFVDYEHWFYGYMNKFQMKPNVEQWLKELKQDFKIKDLYIFGDFSEPNIEQEMNRLKKITSGIIHTASEKDGVDKDFTDVIMLDDSGTLLVNGTDQSGDILYPTYAKEGISYPCTVPDDCLFILGDYRTQAEDSRDFGCIPQDNVKARVITILRRRTI